MLLKTKEICKELNIHPMTLYRWIKKYPDFPANKIGGNWKFDIMEIQRWIEKHTFA